MPTAPPEFFSPFGPALIEPHSSTYTGTNSDHVVDSWLYPELAGTRVNIVPNPSAETSASGWGGFNYSVAQSSADSVFGSNCLLMTNTTAGFGGVFTSPDLAVLPGQWYTFSAYVRNVSMTATSFDMRMDYKTAAHVSNTFVSTTRTVTVGAGWTRVSVSGMATTDPFISLQIYATGALGEQFRVDGIMLERYQLLLPYNGNPVVASRSTTWDVAAPPTVPVSASRSTTWDVKAGVAATRSTTWDAKATVAATRATTWAAKAGVTGSRATTWDALASTAASRSTTWDTAAAVAATRSTTWDALAQVAEARSTTWDVAASGLTPVSASVSTTWGVKAAVAGSRATTWDTKHRVLSTDRFNEALNPSFQFDLNHYAISGAGDTNTWINTDGLFGPSCCEVTKGGAVNSGVRTLSTTSPSLTGSQTWTASAYIKVPAGNEDTNIRIFITWLLSDLVTTNGVSIGPAIVVKAGDGWVRRAVIGTAPAGSAGMLMSVATVGAETSGQKFLVDGVMMEFASTLNYYIDGATNGGAWTGTAHASRSILSGLRRNTTWNVLSSVSPASRATTWDVKAFVSGSRGTTWDVASNAVPVSAARATTWDVKASKVSTRSTTWDAKASIAASRAASWRVFTSVAPASRSTTWDTKAPAVGVRSTSWDTKQQVSAARWALWDCRLAQWFFSPPALHARHGKRLTGENNQRLSQDIGATLIRVNGVWSSVYNQRPDELASAERVYLGGRTYEVTQAEASELSAAGFGAGVTTT